MKKGLVLICSLFLCITSINAEEPTQVEVTDETDSTVEETENLESTSETDGEIMEIATPEITFEPREVDSEEAEYSSDALSEEDEILTSSNDDIPYLNQSEFKDAINNIASDVVNLYFGNTDDYDISNLTLNTTLTNNYYVYTNEGEPVDVYVLAESGKKVIFPKSSSGLFYGSKYKKITFNNVDTSNVTSMASMFAAIVNGADFKTSLEEIYGLENFDTSNVIDMNSMFNQCRKLKSLDVSSFDTSKVTDMGSMFSLCKSLETLNPDNFNTSNVTNMNFMFYACGSLKSLNVSSFDTSKIKNMEELFAECSNLVSLDLSNFNTSNVTNMSYMFNNCAKLETLNISKFNTSNVNNMEFMFKGCNSLTSLDLRSFDTSKVTNMNFMFFDCNSLTSLDLSNFNTSNVTSMQDMFLECSSLNTINVKSFDTSKVTTMGFMFGGCQKLKEIDLSSFNTSNVTSMFSMFYKCKELTSLDLTNFDTSKVTSMGCMFESCNNLSTLNLSGFDTSNVTNMENMFQNCKSLVNLDLSNLNTSNVTNMSYMFINCENLQNLNISNFDTSNVTDMSYMFYQCSGIRSLELSTFDTSNVQKMDKMFYRCKSLEKIYVEKNFDTNQIINKEEDDLFSDCYSLFGGKGTAYDSNHTDCSYAHIDEGEANPGYFTYVNDTSTIFKDVDSSTYHYRDIIWLADNGISKGWILDDGTKEFRPYDTVKRCDMAAFLYRLATVLGDHGAADYTAKEYLWFVFTDIPRAGNIHQTEIFWLAENKISTGWDIGNNQKEFRPLNDVTRADMAAFLRRMASLYSRGDASSWKPSESDWNTFTDVSAEGDYHQEDILWLAHAGISEGWTMEDGTKEFRPLDTVKRCDMAAFLHRFKALQYQSKYPAMLNQTGDETNK